MAIKKQAPAPSTQSGQNPVYFRTVQVLEIEEKETRNGKAYWRVKDDGNRYQTLWDAGYLDEIDRAQESGDALFWAIEKRPPSKPGMKDQYVILAVGDAAKGMQSLETQRGEQLPLSSGAQAPALDRDSELTLRFMDMAVRIAVFEKKTGMSDIGNIARELKGLFEVGIELDEPAKPDSDAGMPADADDDIPF